MINDNNRNDILQASMTFMRTITAHYGADKGMELWETIADTIDPVLKKQIFFALISGEFNDQMILRGYRKDKVSAVRAIREVTGLGLYESKQIADKIAEGNPVTIKVVAARRDEYTNILSTGGIIV